MCVLIVEDEVTLAEQLAKYLKDRAFAVEVAHKGIDGYFMVNNTLLMPLSLILACRIFLALS